MPKALQLDYIRTESGYTYRDGQELVAYVTYHGAGYWDVRFQGNYKLVSENFPPVWASLQAVEYAILAIWKETQQDEKQGAFSHV